MWTISEGSNNIVRGVVLHVVGGRAQARKELEGARPDAQDDAKPALKKEEPDPEVGTRALQDTLIYSMWRPLLLFIPIPGIE